MLNAELQAEEEAKRTEEAKKREAAKAKEETPKEGDGLPRAAEEKPDAGGEAAGRELEALRVRAAELDDRLRGKGLRKAERNKIAEELAGVQARMQELSGGDLVLFSRGDGAQGRPALSPTKAALRDRLLLKIAQTAGIRVIREGTEEITASAARAQGAARLNAMRRRKLKPHEWFIPSVADYARLASQVGTLWHERGDVDAYYLDGAVFVCKKRRVHGDFEVLDVFSTDVSYEEFESRRRSVVYPEKGSIDDGINAVRNAFGRDIRGVDGAENGSTTDGDGASVAGTLRPNGEVPDARGSDAGDVVHTADGQVFAYRVGGAYGKEHYAKDAAARGLRYSLEETFPATAEERAEIERAAKAKGTWLKAPNGQDTKLTPKQWVTVRTAAFKEWFGDWEKRARIQKLIDAPSISLSEYAGQYELTRDSARSWIKNNIEGKSFTIDDTGDVVRIGKVGRKKVTSHGYENDVHLKSIASIPAMLKNATFIDESPKEKTGARYRSFRYYVVGVKMDGVDYTAKLVVGVASDGSLYYDHSLTQIEKGVLSSLALENQPRTQDHQNAPDGIKDTRLFSLLQAQSSLVVDENGEPLVVWHGTDADVEFWAFDTDEESTARKEHVWSAEYPSGTIFATSDRSVAEYYGNRVIPLFVNLREPEIVNVEQGESLVRPFDDEGLAYYDEAIVTDGKDIVVALRNERNVKSATENVGTFDAGNPDIRYSISMAEQAAWDEVLDAYEAGRLSSRNSHTVLNRTPVVLARILSDDGKNPNLKIVIDRSILDKTTGKTPSKFTGEYHHISVKDLRGLLVNLDNPIAVFDSETIPGDKVVLTEIKDFETGENAVVALAIGTKRGYIAVNAVSSIHGRRASSLNKWLKDGKLRYCNTQKFPAAVGVRWGGYPQRAVPGGKSPQRSVSVGVQNPQAAAPSGNASLLTEDDFKDELGVVKVNEENRFSLSMMDDEAAEKVARERRRDGARKKSAKTAARTGSRWRQGQASDVDFSLSKFLIQN